MNRIFYGIFLLLWLCASCTQNTESSADHSDKPLLNSFLREIDSFKNESSKNIEVFNSRLAQMEESVDELENELDQIDLIDAITLAYLKIDDTIAFERVNDLLLNYQDNPITAKGTVWHYYNKENLKVKQGKLAEAYEILTEGFAEVNSLVLAEKDQIYKVRMLVAISSLEEGARLYEQAETTLFRSLEMLDDNNYPPQKELHLYSRINNCLGIVHSGMGNYEQAAQFYHKSISYGRRLEDEYDRNKSLYYYLNNLAVVYFEQENYEEAFNLYVRLREELPPPAQVISRINSKVGYATSGYFAKKLSFKESEEFLEEALDLAEIERRTQVPWVKYSWAKVLANEQAMDDAILLMKSAYELSKEYENTDRELKSLRFLSVNGRGLNENYPKAYADLVEKTWMEERLLQEKYAEIQYGARKAREKADKQSQAKQIWLGISLALLLIGISGFIIISQRSKNKELIWEKQQQVANEEIYKLMLGQRAKLEEGKKIAEKSISEEIHDGILGEMLGIRLILSGLNESSDEAAVQKRQELIEQMQGLEEELRSISHQLNASAYNKVNEFGLALEELLETNCKPVGLQYSYSYTPEFNWDQLPGEVKFQLYRMVQSGLKNTIKHAKASEVEVKMIADKHQISLELRDNGIGFDPSEERKGIGLKNLRSRIQKINGNLEIKSSPGKGTSLHISIPHKYLFAGTKNATTQTV